MTQRLSHLLDSIDMYGTVFMTDESDNCWMKLIDIALTIVEQCATDKLTVFIFNSDYYKNAVALCLNRCKNALLQTPVGDVVMKSTIYYMTTLYHTMCQRVIMFRTCTLTTEDQAEMFFATNMVYHHLHDYMTNMSVKALEQCEHSVDCMCDLFRKFKETREDGEGVD